MKVTIIIPNFNGKELLKKNLPQVLEAVGENEVIVVDDGSTDRSVIEIKNQISNIKNTNKKAKIKLIQNKKNLGFASTVNRGVKEATGELIVLLNTDVVPESNFLTYATAHFSDPKVFAVGFLQKCPENGKVILRGRGIGKFERGFLIHSRGTVSDKDTSDGVRVHSSEVEEYRKTLWVSGGAAMFRKSIWQELGGMDTIYNPFYWEDIDLSYRAQKAGYKLVFEPKSVVMHNQEKGAIRNLYTPGQVKTIAYRNQILFVWLNITDFQLILNHLIWFPYHLFKSLVTENLVFIKAFLIAILKIQYVLRKRWANKKLAVLSDEDILRNFVN